MAGRQQAKRYGPHEYVELNVPLLLHALSNRDYELDYKKWGTKEGIKTFDSLEEELGLPKQTIRSAIRRGKMLYYNLDDVSCFLGFHPSLFIVSEYLLKEDLGKLEALIEKELTDNEALDRSSR